MSERYLSITCSTSSFFSWLFNCASTKKICTFCVLVILCRTKKLSRYEECGMRYKRRKVAYEQCTQTSLKVKIDLMSPGSLWWSFGMEWNGMNNSSNMVANSWLVETMPQRLIIFLFLWFQVQCKEEFQLQHMLLCGRMECTWKLQVTCRSSSKWSKGIANTVSTETGWRP